MVAGVRHEGRPQVIAQYAKPGEQVFLARDIGNRFSRNAIQIRLTNGMHVGFVPERDAGDIAKLLDAGSLHDAYITKILTGGRSPIPVVQAEIFRSDATAEGLVRQDQVPGLLAGPRPRAGCAGSLLVLIAIGIGGLTFVLVRS